MSVIEAAKTLLKVIRNKVSRTKSSSKTALVPVDDTSAAGIPEKRWVKTTVAVSSFRQSGALPNAALHPMF